MSRTSTAFLFLVRPTSKRRDRKRRTTLARLTAALLTLAWFVVGASLPARATCLPAFSAPLPCGGPRYFSSGYTHVITPGCDDSGCSSQNTSITDRFDGRFWALGDGDPDIGAGIDNGSYPALGGWAYIYPGYPAILAGAWWLYNHVDGCIDAASDPLQCMAILLMDVSPNDETGTFALLTEPSNNLGNYNFDQAGDIFLAEVPRPRWTNSVRYPVCEGTLDACSSDTECPGGTRCDAFSAVLASFTLPAASELDGLYLDPTCGPPDELVVGYQLYQKFLPRGSSPPANPGIEWWDAVGEIGSLGEPGTVVLPCGSSTDSFDLYIAAGLALESGYETVYLSGSATRIACGPNLADPEPLTQRKPRNRERPHRSTER